MPTRSESRLLTTPQRQSVHRFASPAYLSRSESLGRKINEFNIEPFVQATATVREKAVEELGLVALVRQIEEFQQS